MRYRAGLILCIAAALLSVIAWLGTGAHFATRWERPAERCETAQHCYAEGQTKESAGEMTCKEGQCLDDFGEPSMLPPRYEPCYEFGLTPNYYVDGVLPIAPMFLGLAGLLFFLGRRQD